MKAAIIAALAWIGPLAFAARAEPPAWVEMTSAGAQARAVSNGPCPTLVVDGHPRRMVERAAPTAAFPNRLCAAYLPAGGRRVSVRGVALPAPKARPMRLVILGDSGCRLKGAIVQHCNDPSGWPFARVAALAAARRPDLVVHVGDYYYRETPCPVGQAACAGSPYGDKWATWKAELFDPAAPLLGAAPWVFVRGNHEACSRGGGGWFRLLDAAVTAKSCPAQSDTFAVPLDGLSLIIVDSADAEDDQAPPELVAAFAASLAPAERTGGPAWIVTHRPTWSARRSRDGLEDGVVNATERAAVKGRDLSRVRMILSGHVHNFASLTFDGDRPAQLVVGTGGDILESGGPRPAASGRTEVDGMAADVFTMGRFGYLVMDRRGPQWVGAFHDLDDNVVATCVLDGRRLTCSQPAGQAR